MKAPGVSGESPSSRELVRRAIAGKPVPRVPTGPLAVHFCAGLAGHSLRRYSTEAGALAESVVRYYERFRPDAVWVSADTWVSAEAMGAAVGSDLENQPLGGLGPATVRTAAEVDRLPRPDPAVQGRYPRMVDAVRRVRRALGDGVYVVACFDQYPFSLAAALMGVDEIMLRLFDDPPMVRALMARCAEYSVAYGAALAEAGADLLSGGDSPAGLLGPELYAEFALPFEREVVTNLQRRTGLPVSLHICGDARPMLAGMVATGADALELDHAVDLREACAAAGPGVALWGNLDPVRVLAQGTPAEVSTAARRAIEAVRGAGHGRFVLSSGCTLAVETPAANLEALLQAAGGERDGGGRQSAATRERLSGESRR
jgi:uroporphyrinogen decarboxylase